MPRRHSSALRCGLKLLKLIQMPHSRPGLEAGAGIEPTHSAFAEPCLTTWLPRPKERTTRGLGGESKGKKAHFALRRQISPASDSPCGAERKKPLTGEVKSPSSRRSTARPTPVRRFARRMATADFFHGLYGEVTKSCEKKAPEQSRERGGENLKVVGGFCFHGLTLSH
jgi:hypothetical protein